MARRKRAGHAASRKKQKTTSSKPNEDFFARLPNELIIHILKLADLPTLLNARLLAKTYMTAVDSGVNLIALKCHKDKKYAEEFLPQRHFGCTRVYRTMEVQKPQGIEEVIGNAASAINSELSHVSGWPSLRRAYRLPLLTKLAVTQAGEISSARPYPWQATRGLSATSLYPEFLECATKLVLGAMIAFELQDIATQYNHDSEQSLNDRYATLTNAQLSYVHEVSANALLYYCLYYHVRPILLWDNLFYVRRYDLDHTHEFLMRTLHVPDLDYEAPRGRYFKQIAAWTSWITLSHDTPVDVMEWTDSMELYTEYGHSMTDFLKVDMARNCLRVKEWFEAVPTEARTLQIWSAERVLNTISDRITAAGLKFRDAMRAFQDGGSYCDAFIVIVGWGNVDKPLMGSLKQFLCVERG